MSAMLIGYVSDERYVALPDVVLEFINDRGESWEVRSARPDRVTWTCRKASTRWSCRSPASARSPAA